MEIFPTHYQSTHILYMLEHIYVVGKHVISLVYQSVNVTHAHMLELYQCLGYCLKWTIQISFRNPS